MDVGRDLGLATVGIESERAMAVREGNGDADEDVDVDVEGCGPGVLGRDEGAEPLHERSTEAGRDRSGVPPGVVRSWGAGWPSELAQASRASSSC